jgi:VWFA-related protein
MRRSGNSVNKKRPWVAFWPILFLGVHVLAQDSPAPPPAELQTEGQRILVDVNLVTLRFAIQDRQGQFLNGLKREQLRVFEEETPKELAFFEPPSNLTGEAGPLWLAFLLDVSGSTFATRSEEILAAQSFFESIQAFTQIGIFGFTDKLILFRDFTSSRAEVLKAFGQARQHLGPTAIYDSLSELVDRMNKRTKNSDRKVVIVVSDAIDRAHAKSSEIIERARAQNITVYTILVPSAAQLYIGNAVDGSQHEDQTALNEYAAQQEAFARLAVQTGGRHFAGYETILDFDQTLAQINDDLYGNLYSVGFYTDRRLTPGGPRFRPGPESSRTTEREEKVHSGSL